MSITEIISASGGGLFVLLTLIEIVPIKANPWSWIARHLGKAINSDVMAELETVKKELENVKAEQARQKKEDDENTADGWRGEILRFNLELIRKERHTKESFNEILSTMDKYEAYCKNNPDYPNNRAKHAIANINRVYDELSATNGFLQE